MHTIHAVALGSFSLKHTCKCWQQVCISSSDLADGVKVLEPTMHPDVVVVVGFITKMHSVIPILILGELGLVSEYFV